jgi:hypothetical protein
MTEIIHIPNIGEYTLKFIDGDLFITRMRDDNEIEDEYEIEDDNEIEDEYKDDEIEDEYKDVEIEIQEEKNYITREELNKLTLNKSKILSCIVKNKEEIISNKFKYRAILNDIWKSMPIQKIIQTTTFNMKLTNENGKKGYIWCPKLNISIQNKDATNTMKEILNMIKKNKYSIKISIKLKTKQIVHYKSNV